MASVVADTHTSVWYFLTSPKLSAKAREILENAARQGDPVYVSTISIFEITYLVEKGRLPEEALEKLLTALADPESAFIAADIDLEIGKAVKDVPREVVPDMPDRIIAATAVHLGLPLVTCDEKIQASDIATVW